MADADFGMDRNKMRDLLGTCKRQALNCALGLSKPGAVLLLDKTKSPKTLSMDLQKKFPDLKTPNWGTVSADSADPKMLVFRLEKRTPGMAGKLKLTLKTVGFGKLQIRNADGTVAETTADDDKPDTAISPLAPQPAPAFDPLDPKVMQHAASDAIAAGDEADAWVRAYLRENTLAPNNTDPSGETVQFDNKSIAVATVVSTTVAAGRLAQLKLGGNDHITTERVQRLVTDMLLAAIPHVPTPDGHDPRQVSFYLQYTFTPATLHVPTGGGPTTTDQPAQTLTGQITFEYHAENQSGLEVSMLGQATWFADEKGGHLTNQSGFTGAQVAWVWSFLDGALQAGPQFQALVGASRAQQTATNRLEWVPTGQVGAGGQVQYAIPGLDGHVLIGLQAGASGTAAQGAGSTVDFAAALTFTYKF